MFLMDKYRMRNGKYKLKKGQVEIFNIGSNFKARNIDIATVIVDGVMGINAYDPSLSEEKNPFIDFVDDRLGHDSHYSVDTRKIRKAGFPCTEDDPIASIVPASSCPGTCGRCTSES
jgi:dTDP-D-glucose 4,6-dehydratase